MAQKYDQWRFVSIITNMGSYDFLMDSMRDFIDLTIAITEAMNKNERADHRKRVSKLQKKTS